MDAQETRIYTAAIITVVVFGSIVLYFIISIVRQQRKNLELHKQIILAEITGIEKDRCRIAYDLHDELGPLLSYIKLKINVLEFNKTDTKTEIEKISNTLDKGLTRIREISYNMMPTVLINSGLGSALHDYIKNIDRHILNIRLIFPDTILLSEQASINIYRIVQEIIHNTIKHASATQLEIVFEKEKSKIIITLKDDGIGFDMKEISVKKSIGLKSLHNRIQLLNGKMFFESNSGTGTEFIFEIPANYEIIRTHKSYTC